MHKRNMEQDILKVLYSEEELKKRVQEMGDELYEKYKDKKGGYTRIVKTGVRRGDAAPMAILELV